MSGGEGSAGGAAGIAALRRGLAAAPIARPPVIVIDGGSGAGKTTLARALVADPTLLPGAQLLRLDDVYPGWDGLQRASDHLVHSVLGPLSRGVAGRWQRWDWTMDAAAEWHDVDPGRPLVVEGSGALSRASRPLVTLGIWVDLETDERRRRAIARDGGAYEPYWDRWAAQEEEFQRREDPRALADVLIDGRRILA